MAVSFTAASSQFLNLGVDLNICRNVSGMTMMAWVRAAETTGVIPDVGVRQIGSIGVGPPPGGTTNSRLSIDHRNTGVRLAARILDADTVSFFDAGTLTAGLWTHVAGAVDCLNIQGYLYLNGVLVSQQSLSTLTAGNTSNTNSKNAAIGADDNVSGGFFSGALEDLRVYDRLVGSSEIQTIYAALGRDGIVEDLTWRFLMKELGDGVAVSQCTSIGSAGVIGSPSGGAFYVGGVTTPTKKRSYFTSPI